LPNYVTPLLTVGRYVGAKDVAGDGEPIEKKKGPVTVLLLPHFRDANGRKSNTVTMLLPLAGASRVRGSAPRRNK